MLLQFAGEDQALVHLTAEEMSSFDESLVQADRGEFATDEPRANPSGLKHWATRVEGGPCLGTVAELGSR